MNIKKVSELTGVSIRTLHYYDEIDLLCPNKNDNGYRDYSDLDLDRLQHIMLYRKMNLSLNKIKALLNNNVNMIDVLTDQRTRLEVQQQQIHSMITLIDQTIKSKNEGKKMTPEEKFKGINFNDNQFEQEAREKYGDKAVDLSQKKINQLSDDGKNQLSQDWIDIFVTFNQLKDKPIEDQTVLQHTEKFYHFLNENFGTYSRDAFYGLADMYIIDERFTNNINQYGEGLAKYMSEAMKYYAMINS